MIDFRPDPTTRSRANMVVAALIGALVLTLLGALPARAQAITQSNLEGRLDKIRQGQRNARIAVEVLIAKHLLEPPDFPDVGNGGRWKNTKNRDFDPPSSGLPGLGGGAGPSAGFLPASLGVARTDEFDAPLGYCARGKGGIPANSPIVYAVIWPGLDGEFQTNCADILQPPGHVRTSGVRESGANGDDYVAFASLNYILGNAVTKVAGVANFAALQALTDPSLGGNPENFAIGELRFVEFNNRIYRWGGDLADGGTGWEDASGFADTDGDGQPDTLTLRRLTTDELRLNGVNPDGTSGPGLNGPLRATNGEVGTFAITPDGTDTLVVTNGDGAAPGNVSVGLKPITVAPAATVNGTVIPVPIVDQFGRVTGFDNTVNLQSAVGSFSWALGGNLNTTSGGAIGEAPDENSNYLGTNDAKDLRLATNGKVRAVLGWEFGELTVGPLNVTGELVSTGSASIGSFVGGSLTVQGPSTQAAPLFRIQNFVGETLTDQVTIAANGTVALKSLGGNAGTTLEGLDRVVVSAETGLLSQVSTSALIGATAWALTGNTGTTPATNFVGTFDGQDLAFRTANIERMRILGAGANAGFVGIGTVAPTARLDIDGTLRARGAATFNDTVIVTNLLTANGGVVTPSVTNAGTLSLNATGGTGTLTASTNGSERLRITSAGRVGIGMTNPARTLDVTGTFGATGAANFGSSLNVVGATTLNGTLAVPNGAATFGNAVTIGGLLRANGGTETTTLITSGNATVGGNLSVAGTSQLTGLVTASNGVNTTALAATTSVTTPFITTAGTLALSATGPSGTITFGTTGTAGTTGTERLRITSTGRVGINPGATVDAALQVNTGADGTPGLIVRGNSATQSADLFRLVRGGGGNVLTADANGSLTLLPFGSAAGNTNELRFAGLSGTNYVGFKAPDAIGANLVWTLPDADGGAGNVLATNGGGRLQWINPLTASSGWTLIGNSATTSGGVLGAIPTAGTNFLGTIDETTPVDLRIVTGNRVRAIFTAAGQFQTNNVALGGGTINNTAIGNLTPSTGAFTTVVANASVTTPLVVGTNTLQLAAGAGQLTLQSSGGPIVARTEGNERLRITTGGSVGINQANPTAMLDVNGTFNAALAATFGNTVTVANTATAAKFIATGGTAAGNGMFLPLANTLAFSTANTERLRIDADGRIGIGMVPVRTLDVTGSFGTTGDATIDGALTVGGATTLNNTLTVSGASAINNTLGVTGLLTASGGINTTNLVASGTGSFGGTLGVTGATTLGDTLTVAGASTLNNTLSVTGATTLANALTVGGASQINNTLGVTGLLTAGGGISTTDLNASGNGSFGGNLGVTGSATVTSLGGAARTDLTGLDRVVMSDSTGLLSQVSTATLVGATAWAITGNTGTNPTNNFLGTRDAADLAIRTNNADRIRILGTGANAGFVGINTTAPTAMLDVNGGLRVRGDSALNGALNVGGATTLAGNLSVGGLSIFTGLVAANGGINTTSVTASANGSFGGTLNVTGASTLGTLSAGNTSISGTLGVNGATTLNNGLTVTAGTTSVGALTASGAVTLSAGTPNGVAYLNGSRVLTTGGALTFDGTNLAVTGAGTATAAKFIPTGGTAAGNGMYLPAANEVAFSTNGAERLRLTSGGNVGIGLSTPTNLLDVGGTFRASGAANFGSSLTVAVGNFTSLGGTLGVTGVTTLTNLGGTAATSIAGDRIVMANNTGVLSQVSTSALVTANAWALSGNPITAAGGSLGVVPTGSFLGATSNQNLQLVTNNTVRAIVTAGGQFQTNNVAIGGGAINGTTIGATTASTGRFTTLDATGNATVAGTLGVTGLTTASGGVRTPTVNGTTALALTADAGTLSLTAAGANIITARTDGAERLRIAANGNVGIGTTNPTNLLEVNGTFRAAGNSTIGGTLGVTGATTLSNTLGVSGATTLSSTLGVSGATTLGNTLTVAGASQVNNTLRATGLVTADVGVRTPSVTSTSTLGLSALNADSIILSTNGAERMRVDASGRIGIGTSTPNSAQVMIQNQSPTLPGLLLRGNVLQVGRILDIQSFGGVTYLSVEDTGVTRASRGFVTEGDTTFLSIAGNSPAEDMGDNDRIVVANPNGLISQVSPGAFVDQYAWGLAGNAPAVSSGGLGDAPVGSFLGTTNASDLRLVTNNSVRAILNSADGRFDVATLRANELSSAFNLILRGGATLEGLRVTSTGRVGVGAGVVPDAQLQVNTGLGTTRGLVINGLAGQTANLFEARVNNVNRFVVSPTGAVSAGSMQVADIGAGAPNTLTPAGYDRVVVANGDGQLSQIAFSQLSNEATWLLAGNTGITSGGNLGQTATGRFLGMVDAQPIRFVTGGNVRAILTAGGQFQSNDVALGGGTINGTAIGNTSPSTGVFTTLRGTAVTATTSLSTPVVQSAGALALSTIGGSAGEIALSAGGNNPITFATDGTERLRLTEGGQLGLGTASPGAQLQVNNTSTGTRLLVVNGVTGQTANLFEAQVNGSPRFTISQAGSVVASGNVRAESLRVVGLGAGAPNNSTPLGYDRVVIANGSGDLSQIAFSQLTNENTWLIAGNIGGTSGGALGSAPTLGSRILGTRDDVDLRLVTNNLVRAIVTRDGIFQANQVGLTGGTIDGVTIGGTTRAAGAFTTATASTSVAAGTSITAGTTITAGTSVITPLVTNTGNLAVTANNGALTLSTAGAVSPGSVTVAAGGDNPISLFTDNVERLRITGALGRVGIGTTTPGAQLQVNTPIDSGIGLIVSGTATATGDLMAVRSGGSDVLRVRRTEMIVNNPLTVNGATSVSSLTVTGATTLTALGGAVGGLSGDRVVVANSSGQLSQVARSTLVTAEAWGLSGNANIGAGNFIGTTDDNDLRFRTNNITRATITAGGQFQSGNVALTGGNINGVRIGNTAPAQADFTTVGATTVNAGSVITPLVTRVNGNLTLSTTASGGGTAGSITLSAGSESPIRFLTTDLGTERMRLTTDGRLGLGMTTPDRTLDILGTFRASAEGSVGGALDVGGRLTVAGGNSPAVNGLTVNGTSLTKIGSLGGDRNEVVLSGFDRVVLANAAGELQQFDLSKFRLTTDPDDPDGGGGGGGGSSVAVDDEGEQLTLALARLNFVGEGVTATASGNNITVSIPGVNGTLTRDPEFDTVRVTDWIRTPRINANGALTVATGGADRLTVTATGQVGIGTASPAAQLQVVPADDDTVGLRITGAATSPAANLLEIGTTGSPTNFRVERTGNLVTTGAVNAGGTITFGTLGGAASGGLGGNDRIVLANGSGRLAQVSPSALIANVGWSLFGNTLDEQTSGGFGQVPGGRYIGTNNAIDVQFVTNGRVRAILTADGAFRSNNAVLTGGSIDGMPIGATTRSTGAFTGVAVTNTLTAGTSVVTPLIANSGNIALTADNGAISVSTIGTNPQGITFSAGGDNTIAFRTDDRERLRIVGGELSPIVIGGAAAIENSMLQINTAQDSTAGLLVVGTAASTGDLLRVGVTNALDPSDPTPVLRARRTGVSIASLVPGTTALAVNGRTQITGSLTVSESATFNTLAGAANTTRGSNDRVVLANGGGVISQVTPEGLVSEFAWALTGNPIAASAGEIGAAPTGNYLGTTSNNDLRLVTNGLVRAIVTRGGQFQSDNVALSGGAIDGTTVGATSRASGAFTTLAANSIVNAPGMTGGALSFTASNGNIGLVANNGQIGLTARGAASALVFSTRPLVDDLERLRITPEGLVGIGTGVPAGQLQVETTEDNRVGLVVNGSASTSGAALLTVNRGGNSLLSVGRTASTVGTSLTVTGTTSVPALNASGAVTFASLAGAAGADDPDFNRVVVANSSGRLSQISRNTLVTNSAWGLGGNANTTPSNFLGTTDEADLRFGTDGTIRATLTSAGVFQIGNAAIASGTIESTTIGLNAPAAAQFTTAVAGTSVTTPLLRNAGALALTTTAGDLSLNAGGLSRITAATNGSERLRIDENGRVFIGDRVGNGPDLIDPLNETLPQLQVNSAAAVSPAVVARGFPGQVANLIEVQGFDLATNKFERELTVNAEGRVNLRSLSGPTNPVVTVGDRIVVSNAQGRLLQVDTVKLITATTWGLTGNAVITQPGELGAAPTGNFLGTTDARNLGLVTNNVIRAMVDSGGTFRTFGNLVANGVTVGRGKDGLAVGNTAVGTNALINSNGGDENSAFGTSALQLTTLGGQNTAVGVRAMQGNFIGSQNTALGVGALQTNFLGARNVAIGFEAGYNEAGDDRLYIANSRNNNLVYGDFSSGRVMINAGNTPPATLGAALQVNTVNTGDVGFVVRGASGQTANLFEARNNGGTAVARISNAGNANFNGTLGVSGATTLSSTLAVSNATTLSNTLTVAGTTTLNGATEVNNTLTVTGVTVLNSNLSVGGTGTITGEFDVNGATRLRNTLLVDGATTISNTLNVTGNATLGGTLGVTSTATASKFVPTGNVTAGNGMYLPTANEVAFSTAGAERLRLDNNGNVGIGTNDPQFRLDVNGNFRASGNATLSGTLDVTGNTTLGGTLGVTGTASAPKFIPTGGTAAGNGMYLPAANTLGFSAGGTETLRVTASGVGIGMTPARALDVTGTFGATGAATFGGATQVNNTLGVSGATTLSSTLGVSGVTTLSNLGASLNSSMGGNDRIVVTNNTGVLNNVSVSGLVTANAWGLSGNSIVASGAALGVAPTGSFLGATSNQNLQLVTNNLVRAIVTSGGQLQTNDVAIGGGAINNTTIGATTASTGRFTTLDATGNATVAGTLGVTGLATASAGVRTPTVNGPTSLALAADAGTLSLAATGANIITASTNGAERLRVAANGNVGIGTNNPTNLLDVAGSFRATGNSVIGGTLDVTGATNVSTLTAAGAVTLTGGTVNGIAYLNGTRQLTTGTALTFDGSNLATTGTATALKFALATGGNNGGNGMYMPVASVLAFSTNGGERLRIDTSGDVGIGTNNPQRRLDVVGTFRASGAGEIGGTLAVTGGLENTAIGATTASTGRFTTLTATGDATVAGTLGVSQATALSGTLTVGGASTLTGLLTANGGVGTTNLNASGTGSFGGLLTASSGVSTTTLTTSGDGTVGGVLRATGGIENTAIGAITPNSARVTTLVATGTTTLTGLLTANGGVGTTTLTTSGAGIIGGSLRVDGTTDLIGALTVNGTTTLVNTLSANGGVSTPTLAVSGGSSVGGLLEANGGIATTTLSASGTVTLQPGTGASITPALQFTSLAGGNFVGFRAPDVLTGNRIWTLPGADGDSGNVLSTDGGGNLVWVNPVTAGAAWTLTGNGATSSNGALGSAPGPGSNFIGTTNNVDLRLVTNNLVRAIVTAGGQFQTNNVLIGGGTINNAAINNTAIGATTASTGRFTTLDATGNAAVGGTLAVTGAVTVDGLVEAKAGITTTTLGADALTLAGNGTIGGTLTVTGVTLLNSAVTANDGLTVVDGLVTDTLTATSAVISGGTLTGMTISGGSFSGGTIDNAIIGATTPVAGTFTALTGTQLAANTSLSTPLVTAADALRLAALTSSVIISTGGAEQLRVDGLGNVGIGTDTPQRRLDVVGSFRASGASEIGGTLDVTGVTTLTGALNANGGITTGALTAASISTGTFNASGLVDLDGSFRARGTSTFDGAVTLSGGAINGIPYLDASKVLTTGSALTFDGTNLATTGTASALKFIPTGGTAIGNGMYLPAADTLAFSTNGVERLRIGSDGRVGIGTGATIGAQLQVNSGLADTIGLVVRGAAGQTANLFEIQDGSGTRQIIVDASGALSIGTGLPAESGFKLDVNGDVKVTGDVVANNINQSSDARFKTNIQAITDALSIVRNLQGVSYDWNRAAFPDRGFSPRPQIGVIAQDVERILPELVSTDAQGFKSVNYTGFIPVLIEGMKQQADRLDAQDARLVTAERTLAMVEERLFQAEAQILQIDQRLGQAESFVARFELTREPDTMIVLTPTFKVQNLTADRAYIEELRAARIEADKARFKELDADDAVIDNVDAARLRGRVVNTGGKEIFVSFGTVAPLFEAAADGHYIVSVSAEDGSYATAQVINAGGTLRVVPTASQGIDVVANGNSVGLVAPSKKVKASWTRTG